MWASRIRRCSSTVGLLWALVLASSAHARKHYNTHYGPVDDPAVLNVHLVPHTHDDVGWLKTVDQYFYGTNSTIQKAEVQYILDAVVRELLDNPDRKFIYVEMAFFVRWYDEQTEAMQANVKKLVRNGQLEFISGGWCMHDEAASNYVGMVDQTTLGHRFLKKEFGVTPRIGWQIDPFGHSAVQGSLMTGEVNFDAVFFGRIDYQDRALRQEQQRMEMVWRASSSLGATDDVFCVINPEGYGPPPQFGWEDVMQTPDDPFCDNPDLEGYNVDELVQKFVEDVDAWRGYYRTNNLMLTMGSDFQYAHAHRWFKELDKLIHYVNEANKTLNVFYSTPSIYVDAVHRANLTWEVKTDDFFPYADQAHGYWTGYFTSRPALKYYVKMGQARLQAARQMELMLALNSGSRSKSSTGKLEAATGVAQHHDAVSGTSKQHVADDYAKRLAIGMAECDGIVSDALNLFTQTEGVEWTICNQLNVSVCDFTTDGNGGSRAESFQVAVYNPTAWKQSRVVRFPVAVSGNGEPDLAVVGPDGNGIAVQLVPISKVTEQLREYEGAKAKDGATIYEAVFEASVAAMGVEIFTITKSGAEYPAAQLSRVRNPSTLEPFTVVENEFVRLRYTDALKKWIGMDNKVDGASVDFEHSMGWYNSSANEGQNSGAYIFRPHDASMFPCEDGPFNVAVVTGPVVQEVWQTFCDWITVVTRLYTNAPFAEVEYTIGSIPNDEEFAGKEVISRFNTSVSTADVFYTDSNGRDVLRRQVNYRPTWTLNVTEPVAGNYYPINSMFSLKDDEVQVAVMPDRAISAASTSEGNMEFMVHRRIQFDDSRGVGEPLNETMHGITDYDDDQRGAGPGLIIRSKHLVAVSAPEQSYSLQRPLAQAQQDPFLLAFAEAPGSAPTDKEAAAQPRLSYSAMDGVSLPENVQLMTLQLLEDGTVLLRLAHVYGQDEDAELSKSVSVDLSQALPMLSIESITELTLSANQAKATAKKLRWHTQATESTQATPAVTRQAPLGTRRAGESMVVTLSPMEIRTFNVKLSSKAKNSPGTASARRMK